jgi:putative NADH-flavin reductase
LLTIATLNSTKIVIFGSSGKTGYKIVQTLFSEKLDSQVVCPVRNMAKARAVLGPESRRMSLIPCDIARDGKGKFTSIVSGSDVVIICSAFSPGKKLQSSV